VIRSRVVFFRRLRNAGSIAAISFAALAPFAVKLNAAPPPAEPAQASKIDRFLGVYQPLPPGVTLPGGLHDSGDLKDLALTPAAMEKQKSTELKWDAARNCRIVGPVRMMARANARFEFVPSLDGGLYMLFKNANLGSRREFKFAAAMPKDLAPFWIGHSIAHWKDADTFEVQTAGFNDRTWLNDQAAPHSDQLHTTEEYHLLPNGDLRLTMTVIDPVMLAHPFTYVRYFQRQTGTLGELFCEEEFRQNP
jgi:hypothetical protein